MVGTLGERFYIPCMSIDPLPDEKSVKNQAGHELAIHADMVQN
jgi:hypothetical protein